MLIFPILKKDLNKGNGLLLRTGNGKIEQNFKQQVQPKPKPKTPNIPLHYHLRVCLQPLRNPQVEF